MVEVLQYQLYSCAIKLCVHASYKLSASLSQPSSFGSRRDSSGRDLTSTHSQAMAEVCWGGPQALTKKQQCHAAAGAAIVSFVFWPWDSCSQPSGHERVGSSQISLSSGHVAPGELHFYYWFVLCENGHHYKVLRSPIKPPWSCRLQRERKGQREDWCPSYTPAKVKLSSCLHLTYFGILGLDNLQLLFLR